MTSRAGGRGIVLPAELLALHRSEREREREHAGAEWREGGWTFAQPTGKAIDPRRDLTD